MRVPRLFTRALLQTDSECQLEEAQSHYLSRVLRMDIGRPLVLFNGLGGEYTATISQLSKKHVSATINSFSADNRQSPLSIHLGIAISKGDRFELVLQKATELGVTQITPLLTERTEFKAKAERLAKKESHWQQVIIAACEQSQRNLLPEIHSTTELTNWLPTLTESHKFVLHHRSDTPLSDFNQPNSVALVIGPEGGLSESEIQQAVNEGFHSLTLGPRVLRTETAPITAISLLQYIWGDLN